MTLRLWTEQEDETILALRASGLKNEAVAIEVNRTHEGVANRFRWLKLSKEERAEYRREKSATRRSRAKVGKICSAVKLTYPPQVFEDRNKRYAIAPRDLTASFCGDPLPGHSALDRRQSA